MSWSTEAPCPEEPKQTSLRGLLNARAEQDSDRLAFAFLDDHMNVIDRLTFSELARLADSIALRLASRTIPGDRVLLAFDNCMDAVCLFWGCVAAGVIPVPAPSPKPPRSKARNFRLLGIAADADVTLAMASDEQVRAARVHSPELNWLSMRELLADELANAPANDHVEATANQIAYLQYTSGSTSEPRGVEITHANAVAQCQALGAAEKTDPDQTRALIWLPWFHDYGLVHGLIQPVYTKMASFLMPTSAFMLNPLKWLEAIDRHQITHSGGPDFAYAACAHALARQTHWSARLGGWQLASNGAEPVRASTLEAFAKAFAPHGFCSSAFAPSYGLAEAVLGVTMRNLRSTPRYLCLDAKALERKVVVPTDATASGARTLVSCGAPLPGFAVRIVDPATHVPSAPDHVGEIWVSGPSVAQGYWNQTASSEDHFRATLATEADNGQTYLRTGDLGFLSQGELFIAGRYKDLIVVNGRNIYPQDLEHTAQTAHPAVRSGGVMAVSVDKGLRESVVLLLECSRRQPPEVVRRVIDEVRKQIALEHELDLLEVVPLHPGALPRTSSGKPQRSAARGMYMQGTLEPVRLVAQAPSGPEASLAAEANTLLVEALTRLWTDVLGHDSIDPDANFFDLGGDSLLATQLVSRLRTRLGIELPISALFEAPTVRALARLASLAQGRADEQPADLIPVIPAPPGPRTPGSRVSLSFSQERMWFMHELAPESSAYNVPLALRLHGTADTDALHIALTRVVERHEVLRTRFIKTPEGVVGEVVPAAPPFLEEVHLAHDGPGTAEDTLHRHLADVTSLPFQLDRCPLLRAQLVRIEEQETVLLIVMHHIVSDQWSFAELGREIAMHYSAELTGGAASLPALPVQYADYASWHRSWFEGERRLHELSYWSQRLEGLESLPLNVDIARPRQQSFRGAALRIPMAPGDIVALRRVGALHGASLSMVLLAALKVMLYRHTGKTDIAVGVPIANRHHLASENLIGTFVNTLVFRTDLSGDPDFRTVLGRVRDVSLEAFAHQDMPFEVLVRELANVPGASRQPLFNVMFNMVNAQARDCHFEGLTWSRLDFDRTSTQFDLTVVADMLYDQALVIEYATDLFTRGTVQRMGEHLQNILCAAIDTAAVRVATLPMLGATELADLRTWSLGPQDMPGASPPIRTVVEWVARGAREAPQQDALVFKGESLTHRELDEASNRLARVLQLRGITRGAHVGLCLPRGHDLVVALLAILKTGAAYVPLDPDYPSQRLNYQIQDADLSLMVTHRAVAKSLGREYPLDLLLDEHGSLVAGSPADPLDTHFAHDTWGEDAAYLIYTSGSTGQPKGVAVPHRAVVNFLTSMANTPGLTPQDRLLAVTTPSFDIAVLELLLPLGMGGTVVIASEAQVTDGKALADVMTQENITVLQATPSRWHLLIDSGWAGNSGLKALVGGEPLTPSLALQLLARCGEVWNMYGPTETTVWSSCWCVQPDAAQAIALGRPVANTSVQVLDEHRNPCPIGVPGEIYIGGTGVALGYYKRPELTDERFIDQPDAPEQENRRIYRTGDRGRWRHDGSLEHGGRLDDQIKLRGYRIELGEIETHLLSHPGVARTVVMLREDQPGQAVLVAYVVPHGPMPAREELRQHLRQWLPDHMVPGVFVEIESLPILPNGKTNRRALPMPQRDRPTDASSAPAAPRTATETTIWLIWKEALQLDRLGIHDNFFDLGGHSILAVSVVSRIEAALGRPCALGLLFENGTVAGLATALDPSQEADTADIPVAVLQPHGSGPGLFLLAGAQMYRSLSQQLDAAMPVYGVFSQTEIDLLQWPADAEPPAVSVETLAVEYLALIRGIQPHGPYFLGGFSIGGALAYEVAQRLRVAGEEIGLIVLLDSMLPGRGFRHFLAGLRRRLRLLRREGLKHLVHIYRVYRYQSAHRHESGSRRNRVYAEAIRAYDARPCDLPMVFLQAGDDASTEPAYGWRKLVPELTVERVPGKHMDILEPPNVDMLAHHVRVHIAAAKAACARPTPQALSVPANESPLPVT